jgi:hypothetical protein
MQTRTYLILKYSAILMALLLLPISYGNATSIREVSIDEMLQQSQFVFEGTVTAIESRENSQKRIHTYVTFEVKDVIKGVYDSNIITLSFLGGTVGDRTMAVSDMQFPQKGEHGIYFVESLERAQVNPLYGWSQGHFIVERDVAGSERMMTNKRLSITAVADKVQSEPMTPGTEHIQAQSKGAVPDLVVTPGKKGLTVEEFKMVLRGRISK